MCILILAHSSFLDRQYGTYKNHLLYAQRFQIIVQLFLVVFISSGMGPWIRRRSMPGLSDRCTNQRRLGPKGHMNLLAVPLRRQGSKGQEQLRMRALLADSQHSSRHF